MKSKRNPASIEDDRIIDTRYDIYMIYPIYTALPALLFKHAGKPDQQLLLRERTVAACATSSIPTSSLLCHPQHSTFVEPTTQRTALTFD
jgi:hypothetical protein